MKPYHNKGFGIAYMDHYICANRSYDFDIRINGYMIF